MSTKNKGGLDEEIITLEKTVDVLRRELKQALDGLQKLLELRAERDYGVKRGSVVIAMDETRPFKVIGMIFTHGGPKPMLLGNFLLTKGKWEVHECCIGTKWELEEKNNDN
jgi:hypothetical protein